jgi:hypothetical protein
MPNSVSVSEIRLPVLALAAEEYRVTGQSLSRSGTA